jgi:hypothetical protein
VAHSRGARGGRGELGARIGRRLTGNVATGGAAMARASLDFARVKEDGAARGGVAARRGGRGEAAFGPEANHVLQPGDDAGEGGEDEGLDGRDDPCLGRAQCGLGIDVGPHGGHEGRERRGWGGG